MQPSAPCFIRVAIADEGPILEFRLLLGAVCTGLHSGPHIARGSCIILLRTAISFNQRLALLVFHSVGYNVPKREAYYIFLKSSSRSSRRDLPMAKAGAPCVLRRAGKSRAAYP
ncbi:hypothetical protein MES5069_360154 [Mesorhizobium escarrei]|uniref:Uncharacterized protein n=1 Tax=Mesorhizobium escarrei TaxID=666018 RepID=A0ABN8K0U4_9HYPH|nr:hypothetical protein MES5069_360154 [Mesorhizobium escarrei]